MRISDWSSGVCSSDLPAEPVALGRLPRIGEVCLRELLVADQVDVADLGRLAFLDRQGHVDAVAVELAHRGGDAWSDARAQEYLGDQYNAADYERIVDILDVWFDSGCTHAFVLESGRWPALVRHDGSTHSADLYLEGSDQHRGWFQSSLLESCGTRGQAPYTAVLTHGFTLAAKGFKIGRAS